MPWACRNFLPGNVWHITPRCEKLCRKKTRELKAGRIYLMEEFSLAGREFIELHNLLKVTGLCPSGGQAKALIAEGLVRVDGQVELRKRCKIRSGQVVHFDGREVVVSSPALSQAN